MFQTSITNIANSFNLTTASIPLSNHFMNRLKLRVEHISSSPCHIMPDCVTPCHRASCRLTLCHGVPGHVTVCQIVSAAMTVPANRPKDPSPLAS